MNDNESAIKISRLGKFLDRHALDGVLLRRRDNFAWITCGKDNHILNSSPSGVAAILATRDGKRVCFTNTIEAPRFEAEELAGTGIAVVSYPWFEHESGKRALRELIAGRRIAADEPGELPMLPDDFVQLRWSLTDEELDRYRDGGRRTSTAIERACRHIKPGRSEHEIAGILDHEVHASGCNPVVTLVAVDERIERFRHPIPTANRLKRYAMLVSCAEFAGLISNVTRFVHFGPIPADLKRRHQAVCNVDVAVNLATGPGKSLGELFDIVARAYADNGYAGQERQHHQGGSTGYAAREVFAEPGSTVKVLDRQAFAWNPSITGTKSEDTIFCTENGIEILTECSRDWPRISGRWLDQTLDRPDMLTP